MSTTKKVLQVITAMAFIVALFALAFGEVVPHPEDLEFKLSQTKVASTGSSWPSNPNASIGALAPEGYNPGPSARSVSAVMPEKEAYDGPQNEGDPSNMRQGGDDCASATVIGALPYDNTGTTADYFDDYEETGVFTCPYASTSPDVVYSFTPGASMYITIDLCASGYDTKVMVYENDCAAAAYDCDDDGCPGGTYRSLIEGMAVTGGNTYYIVIDGYGGDFGDYVLHVEEYVYVPPEECLVECPPEANMESEACGADMNGGCNMDIGTETWEPIACGETVCGTIWADGGTRDTDWYEVVVGAPGPITWTVEAEFDVVAGFISGCPDGAPDCACITQLDPYATGACNEVLVITYEATAAGTYWLFVSHQAYEGLPCDINNDYVATVTCGELPPGRCCYGDPYAPDCASPVTLDECNTLGGDFVSGLNCVDDPCPVETPCAECPPEGIQESEPCGADMNGGCNMTSTPTWEPIACGETICGTVWADGSTRDTDWFELVLTSDANITFECEAEFPFVVGYIAGCPMGAPDCGCITELDPYATGDACTSQFINMDLTAGTHWLFISHQLYEGYPCGGDVDYVATLTCGEPPVGRCCYGDPFNPSCDDVTPGECAALGGTWDGAKNCTDDPCPIPEGNDDCIGAELMTDGMEVNGTTAGAMIDCPGVLDWNAVWYYFENPYACAHATMDYCNVTTPVNLECLGVVIYEQCDDCPNYILYTTNTWVECGTASTQPITTFEYLPAGTYYYPVFIGDAACENIESAFSFFFTLDECPPPEPGDACDDPLVINLPADLDYLDAAQTTCGRLNMVSETCLGYYDGGEDIHYVVNVTAPVDVDVRMDPLGTATYTGMLLDDACPADPTTCLYDVTSSGSNELVMSAVHLEPGTYYIMVDTWPSPTCIPTFNLAITAPVPPTPGDDCTDPIEVKIPTDLPYADIANHTCERGDYTETTCLGYYDGGDDIFYEVQVTTTTMVTITMDPKGTTYTGIVIDDNCPADETDCIAFVTGSSGTTLKVIEDLLLDPGTYYIMIDTWPSPQCIPDFDLFIEAGLDPAELAYTPSSFDFGTVSEGDNGTGTLTLDNIGQAELNYSLSVMHHAPSAPEIDGAYMAAMGDYSPGATMDVTFVLQNDSQDAEWLDEATITFPTGVFVNNSTDFIVASAPTHYLQWDGTVGDNQTTVWFDHNGGYGNIYSTETAEATINITFGAGLAGPITLPYTISGDDWGGDPHDVSGIMVINQVDPAAGWLSVAPTSGTIPGSGVTPQDVTVGWDAAGLYNETYEADIIISHDGVNKGSAVVPVTVTVTGGDLKAAMGPDPMYIYYQFGFNPYMGSMYIGNFNAGYSAANVATMDIGGVAGTFVQTHPSMAGFAGDVAEFSFPVAGFLAGLGAPLDLVTVPFSITGTFDDAAAFGGGGHVDVYGKSSASGGKQWIVPQDEVVLHGDVDVSGYLDIDDVVGLISYIFQGGIIPGPAMIGDCDCSADTDIDDVVYMIAFIFQGGPDPCYD